MRELKEEEYRLYRLTIIKIGKEYIKARGSNGKKLIIKVNKETEGFQKGHNYEFYAKVKIEGIMNKKILYVIDYEEYLELIKDIENKCKGIYK